MRTGGAQIRSWQNKNHERVCAPPGKALVKWAGGLRVESALGVTLLTASVSFFNGAIVDHLATLRHFPLWIALQHPTHLLPTKAILVPQSHDFDVALGVS